MLFVYKLSRETSPHSICSYDRGGADPLQQPNPGTVWSLLNSDCDLRAQTPRLFGWRREGVPEWNRALQCWVWIWGPKCSAPLTKDLKDGHERWVSLLCQVSKMPRPTLVAGASFCPGHAMHIPKLEPIQICFSINMSEIGDGCGRHGKPSACPGAEPWSRAVLLLDWNAAVQPPRQLWHEHTHLPC